MTLRPGRPDDAAALAAIRDEPAVVRFWGPGETAEELRAELAGADPDVVVLVIEVAGEVAGAIQYAEEADVRYRHAGIDIYLATRHQGRGLGVEAVRLLARHLLDVRGHHRLVIDPAADNLRAIAAYARVGFRPVGTLRRYEQGADGSYHDGLLMELLAGELID